MSSISEIESKGGIVYLLTSPSGKQYVGQTWNLHKRVLEYKNRHARGQDALHNAIVKYGWDNFSVAIIACGIQTQDALDKTEIAFIALLGTMKPAGYNLMSGGMGGGHSPESIKKMSAAKKGKTHSPEHVAAIKDALAKPEVKTKMSNAMRGEKNPNFGKTTPPETIAKMRASAKVRWARPGEREKQSAARLGKKTLLEIGGKK